MNRILLLLTCLLAVVVVISLPDQKAELKRGATLPILPAVPVPQQLTMGMTAAGRIGGAAFSGTPPRRAARIVKTPVLARGSEHSIEDARGLANVHAQRTMGMTAVRIEGAVVKTPVQARGWEHSSGDVPGLANVEAQTPLAGLLTPSMKGEAIVCGAVTMSNCGYDPKKGALPLNLRRSGAGIALTISDTNIWIEPGGVRFSMSVSF